MESHMTLDILHSALEELYRVELRLRANPDFQRREALWRVIELYPQAEDRLHRTDPAVASDLSVAPVSPENLSGTHQSSDPEMALTRPATVADKPPTRRRGGWTKGDSKSSRMRDAAVAYLREIKRPASGGEICRALLAKGVEIGGRKPSATLACQLTGSHLFYHTDQGYGLTEWLNNGTTLPNAGHFDGAQNIT
jgi:hypothetical protein